MVETPWWTWLSPAGFVTNLSLLASEGAGTALVGEDWNQPWTAGVPDMNALVAQAVPWIALILIVLVVCVVLYIVIRKYLWNYVKEWLDFGTD